MEKDKIEKQTSMGEKGENIDWGKAYKIFYNDKENILQALRRGVERYPYVKEVLLILAAGTLVSAALLMPGLPRVLAPFVWQVKGYKKDRLSQTLKRLQKQKVIEVVETEDGPVVKITQNGLTRALKYKLDEMKIKRSKSWDKEWRIVIFDIPEGKRRFRDVFRDRLKQLGFYQLQKSVFVHAFPCFNEVEFLRQVYEVDIDVTYIVAKEIEGQERLKEFFRIG